MQTILKLTILIFLLIPNSAFGEEGIEQDWQRVNINGKFTFEIPSDMHDVKVQGKDSYVKKYENLSMTVSFDYGAYSDPLKYSAMSEYSEEMVEIGGKKAKFVKFLTPGGVSSEFNYVAAVHFNDLDESESTSVWKTKLTMFIYCEVPKYYREAEKILKSIRFSTSQE